MATAAGRRSPTRPGQRAASTTIVATTPGPARSEICHSVAGEATSATNRVAQATSRRARDSASSVAAARAPCVGRATLTGHAARATRRATPMSIVTIRSKVAAASCVPLRRTGTAQTVAVDTATRRISGSRKPISPTSTPVVAHSGVAASGPRAEVSSGAPAAASGTATEGTLAGAVLRGCGRPTGHPATTTNTRPTFVGRCTKEDAASRSGTSTAGGPEGT